MKRPVKVPAVAAVILTLAMAGVSSARAGGWPVAAGVVGGFAAETIVGRAVANYPPPPAYYVYPQRVYVAPLCARAPVIVPLVPVCYATAPVVYPFYDPPIQLGGIYGAAALLSPVVGRAQVHVLRRKFSDSTPSVLLSFLLWLKFRQRLGQEFLVQIRPARMKIRPVGDTLQRPLKQVRIEPEQPVHLMKSQPIQAELSLDVPACE